MELIKKNALKKKSAPHVFSERVCRVLQPNISMRDGADNVRKLSLAPYKRKTDDFLLAPRKLMLPKPKMNVVDNERNAILKINHRSPA